MTPKPLNGIRSVLYLTPIPAKPLPATPVSYFTRIIYALEQAAPRGQRMQQQVTDGYRR